MHRVIIDISAVAGDVKRTVRLLVQRLTESDLARITTFLRIGAARLQCEWELVFEGSVQVLMWAGDEPETVFGTLEGPVPTLHVVDTGAHHPAASAVLIRPLQYEAFIDALSALERLLTGGAVAAGAPAETSTEPPTATPTEAPPATTEVGAAIAEPAPAQAVVPPDSRFRLRRWPPAAVMQHDPYHLRLASCLSARHVTLDELAVLSNVAPPECEKFVATLLANGLIDARLATPTPAHPQPVAKGAPHRDKGLFKKIRRRLGLILLR